MRRLVFISLLLLLLIDTFAQVTPKKQLTVQEFFAIVEQYHPIAKQADIILDKGKKQLRAARGAFDPKIYSSLSEKDFDKKNYYNISETGLKIPTWYGLTLKTAYEKNTGVFLSPENKVPKSGLGVFGASATLGKGLFMDDRRAALRKAQLFRESSEMEQQLLLNQLFFDATISYYQWLASYRNVLAYTEAKVLSFTRVKAVKQSYLFGDVPAIDTLEAMIQLRDIEIDYRTAQSDLVHARNRMSVFMWNENGESVLLDDDVKPRVPVDTSMKSDVISVRENIDKWIEQHPKLKILSYKTNMLTIDKRLKAEKLKPTINLNYNFITTDYNTEFSNNDFKWGFTVGIPLFLREGRGEFALAKLKLRENEYTIKYFESDIKNKTLAIVNELDNLLVQFEQYNDLVRGYERLLAAEETKFSIGESSMFKVNARQLKLLNTRIKANKNIAKLYQSRGKLYKELGVLHLNP